VCTSGRRAWVQGLGDGAAGVHALVMRLLLRQDATDEGAGVLVRRFPAVAGPQVLLLECVDGRGYASSEQPYCAHLPRALGVLQGDGREDASSAQSRWAHVQVQHAEAGLR
jgi:hypothetical protein